MAAAEADRAPFLDVEPAGPIVVRPGQTVRIVAEIGAIPGNERAWDADQTTFGEWRDFASLDADRDRLFVDWTLNVFEPGTAQHRSWGHLDQYGRYRAPDDIADRDGFVKMVASLKLDRGDCATMVAMDSVVLCFPGSMHRFCENAKPFPDRIATRLEALQDDLPDCDGALRVTHRGTGFAPDRIELGSGRYLRIEQDGANDALPRRSLTLFLPVKRGAVPERRRFPDLESSRPMSLATSAAGEGERQHGFVDHHQLEVDLEFGELERDELELPGRLRLSTDDGAWTACGRFAASVTGLVLAPDGQPDLRTNAHENLHWLAERRLGPGEYEHLEYVIFLGSESPDSGPGVDYAAGVVRRRHAGDVDYHKFWFDKTSGRWAIARQLPGWQLLDAHPLTEPPSGVAGEHGALPDFDWLRYRAAQWLERRHVERHGRSPIYVTGFDDAGWNNEVGLARITVVYTHGTDAPQQTARLLFRLEDGFWDIERPLEDGERVDFRRGRVVSEP